MVIGVRMAGAWASRYLLARAPITSPTVTHGHRCLGATTPGGVGVRDHQLRLVDRHRPRRDVHLGDPPAGRTRSGERRINRFAEAMTLFAVVHAGIFPLLHLGRPWFAYWIVPLPQRPWRVWPPVPAARCRGRSRSGPTSRSRSCSGTSGSSPTWRPCATGRKSASAGSIYGVLAPRLARLGTPLAAATSWLYWLLAGLATPLVRLGALDREHSISRIALVQGWHSHHLPAVLRRRGHLLRVRDGADAGSSQRAASSTWGSVVTPAAHRQPGASWRSSHWIVIYQAIIGALRRAGTADQTRDLRSSSSARPAGANAAIFWAQMICNVLVPPAALVSRRSEEHALALDHLDPPERRDVVRAVRDHRHGAATRVHPVGVARLSPDVRRISRCSSGRSCFFLLLVLIFLRLFPFIPVAEVKELNHELSHREDH